jgi:hypothetical protein
LIIEDVLNIVPLVGVDFQLFEDMNEGDSVHGEVMFELIWTVINNPQYTFIVRLLLPYRAHDLKLHFIFHLHLHLHPLTIFSLHCEHTVDGILLPQLHPNLPGLILPARMKIFLELDWSIGVDNT